MTFVDTSFLVALARSKDEHHHDAVALLRQRRGLRITSDRVVEETWTWLRRRVGHRAAVMFLDTVTAGQPVLRLQVVPIDADLAAEAWTWLRTRDEREYSFVDAAGFAVMRQRGLTEAMAFDGDFAAAGFVELRP